MQDQLDFGGGLTYEFFSFDCRLSRLMDITWSLACSLICIWWFYVWANLVSMIAHYYLLPRYAPTPTLLILMHDLFYYLIISLVSITFLVNCHVCFTLFSRDLFLGVVRSLSYLSNKQPDPRPHFGFAQIVFSK